MRGKYDKYKRRNMKEKYDKNTRGEIYKESMINTNKMKYQGTELKTIE